MAAVKADAADTLDDSEYEVESIEDHRVRPRKKTIQYYIKWKGYSSDENTWEDEENVNAEELIKSYWAERDETPSKNGRAPTITKKTRAVKESNAKAPRKRARLERSVSAASEKPVPLLIPEPEYLHEEESVEEVLEEEDHMKAKERRESTPPFSISEEPVPDDYRADWDWKKEAVAVKNVWRDPIDDPNSELYAKVQWRDNVCVWHRNKVLRDKCPELLISFYESRLKFQP